MGDNHALYKRKSHHFMNGGSSVHFQQKRVGDYEPFGFNNYIVGLTMLQTTLNLNKLMPKLEASAYVTNT